MKKVLMIAFMASLVFFACTGEQHAPAVDQPDMEKIENIVNFSLMDNRELPEYIKTTNDDYKILEMIVDYNTENDKSKISNTKLKSDLLQRKVLLLIYNL